MMILVLSAIMALTFVSDVQCQAFAGAGAMAGPGAMAGGFPFGSGFPFGPNGFPNMPPMVFPKPWYTGPNVCKQEKVLPVSDELSAFLGVDAFSMGNSMSNSETCKGNDFQFVCTSQKTENGVSKVRAVKYNCCPGFIRPNDGSVGCVVAQRYQAP